MDEAQELLTVVERAKGGDTPSFARLYERYLTPIYRYIFILVRNKEDAEDLTQTVFVKALERLGSFDASKGSFSTWLYRIAKNTVIDASRKRKPILFDEPEGEQTIPEQNLPNGEQFTEEREKKDHLHTLLRELTDDAREILTLKFIEEKTNTEIATITGKTEAAIRKIQSRALAQLRTHHTPYAY